MPYQKHIGALRPARLGSDRFEETVPTHATKSAVPSYGGPRFLTSRNRSPIGFPVLVWQNVSGMRAMQPWLLRRGSFSEEYGSTSESQG
jgi:hypothetical protein